MARIFVSGSCGFIGSHLTDALVESGHEVIGLDDLSAGTLSNANPKSNTIIGSVLDLDLLGDLFKQHNFDYVYHLAAQINLRKSIENPGEDAQTNILGSLAIVQNCIKYGVKKLIFSSTGGAIYNPTLSLPFTEKSEAKPNSPYGLSKLTVENYLRIMKNLRSLDYVALRYSNVYGPRQNARGYCGVISIFKDRALNNEELIINGDGLQTRDFIFCSDVVKANLIAQNLSGTYNVSSNTEITVNYIAKKIIEITGSKSKIVHATKIKGEMERCKLDSNKLKNETSWEVSVPFDIGLQRTINE